VSLVVCVLPPPRIGKDGCGQQLSSVVRPGQVVSDTNGCRDRSAYDR
jgi:hypothetical protein